MVFTFKNIHIFMLHATLIVRAPVNKGDLLILWLITMLLEMISGTMLVTPGLGLWIE